jgi:hypothetical protein
MLLFITILALINSFPLRTNIFVLAVDIIPLWFKYYTQSPALKKTSVYFLPLMWDTKFHTHTKQLAELREQTFIHTVPTKSIHQSSSWETVNYPLKKLPWF